nr:hypothetical protein [Nitratireductor pacificus]
MQAVEPNSETRAVSGEPQRGQVTSVSPNSARMEFDALAGGAMP